MALRAALRWLSGGSVLGLVAASTLLWGWQEGLRLVLIFAVAAALGFLVETVVRRTWSDD